MASAPSDREPILGRVDAKGRLIAADPELERLQVEAGSSIGAGVALPQLAAIARTAQRLQVPVSRRVLAAGNDQDVDMWVRAVPEDGEVALAIEQWAARPPSPQRLSDNALVQHEKLEAEPLSWSVDEQLRIVSLAPALAEALSLDRSTAEGQPLTKLFRLEENGHGSMPLLDALASRSEFDGQPVRSRGSDRDLVLRANPLTGPNGEFAGFEGVAVMAGSDTTALDSARAQLDSAIPTALQLPLDSIVNSAEEMIGRSNGPVRAEYAAYAADIATAARHLLSVIRSLKEESSPTPSNSVDLCRLAGEAVALVESAAKERRIAIAVERGRIFANGDGRSITQVLVNLIGNAVRYSPEGSAVTISFERSGDRALVHVADRGPGIDPADQQRIFEAFEKGSAGGDGSGLGLAIARRLARSMGGDVHLESTPGEGSRFTLALSAG